MTRRHRIGLAAIAVASGMTLAACDAAKTVAPTETSCTTAALKGVFGSQRNGQTAPGSMLSAVGLATFDGNGTIVERQMVMSNGVFSAVPQLMSTYAIDADCTGTQRDANGVVVARLVMVHGTDEVLGMSLVPGSNVAVHYERIVGPCSNATLIGTYGFQRNGQAGQGVQLLSIGTIDFDGAGNQTGNQLIARSGTTGALGRFVGKYSINADCTGTQSDSIGAVFSQIVVVDGGEEVLGISTSPGNNVVVHYERAK